MVLIVVDAFGSCEFDQSFGSRFDGVLVTSSSKYKTRPRQEFHSQVKKKKLTHGNHPLILADTDCYEEKSSLPLLFLFAKLVLASMSSIFL